MEYDYHDEDEDEGSGRESEVISHGGSDLMTGKEKTSQDRLI